MVECWGMKKLFVVMFLGVLLVSPSITRAQSVNQQTIDDLRAELIALLVEQVAILQAQLDALQAQTQRTAEVNKNGGDTDIVLGSTSPEREVTVDFSYRGMDDDGNHTYRVVYSVDAEKAATTLVEDSSGWEVIGAGMSPINKKTVWDDIDLKPGEVYTWKVVSVRDGVEQSKTGQYTATTN